MVGHKLVLVLNQDFSPIGLVDWKDAITLQFKDVITIVDYYEDYVQCTCDRKWPLPAVIALKQYEKIRSNIPYSKKNVFIRDKLCCQYCGKKFKPRELTVDHVYPRSKWNHKRNGTPTHWGNIVTCCFQCNSKKGNKTPEEAGMKLKRQPVKPNGSMYIKGFGPYTKIQKEWLPYIPKIYLDITGYIDEN
jgi:5-methylcytosine-specific restriction endonuclease McrA